MESGYFSPHAKEETCIRIGDAGLPYEVCILGNLTEPYIYLTPAIKLINGAERFEECFLCDFFCYMFIPGQRQGVFIDILKIEPIDFFKFGHFLTTFIHKTNENRIRYSFR